MGGGKKKVCKSSFDLKCHCGTLPNERDGMSVMVFLLPFMCCGVSRQQHSFFRRSASAAAKFAATMECHDASRVTQLTVGMLLLNSAIFFSLKSHITSSMTKNTISSPAISRSEFVIVPFGLLSDSTFSVISLGHCSRTTVGGHSLFSPTITPPKPKDDASQMPT